MGGIIEDDEIEICRGVKNFVETGTYRGVNTLNVSKHFENVYTIEIVPNLYELSKKKFIEENKTNIKCYLGDSLEILPQIVPKVHTGAVWFLDSHQSGHDTGNNGVQDVPLLEELDTILQFKLTGKHIFMLDDLRLWKDVRPWDWAHISTKIILDKFKTYGYTVDKYFEKNDRLYIIFNN